MKKRSRAEIHIRNVLTDMLMKAIECCEISDDITIHESIFSLVRDNPDVSIDLKKLRSSLLQKASRDIPNTELTEIIEKAGFFKFQAKNEFSLRDKYKTEIDLILTTIDLYQNFLANHRSLKFDKSNSLRERIVPGIALFNDGLYFESHEYLEGVWMEVSRAEKKFIKALIHLAVAMYHLKYENIKGAKLYLKRSLNILEEYRPEYLGLKLDDLKRNLDLFKDKVNRSKGQDIYRMNVAAPRIEFV